jgi:hypothetical protein
MSIYIFIKNTLRITNAIRKKGGLDVNLVTIDPELQEDFINCFAANVSQREAINETLLGRIAKGYADIDEVMRLYTWNCTYIAVKEAGRAYITGKFSANKFFNITNIDTMMADAQILTAINLISSGKVRELANYVADLDTLDMHRAYKITELSFFERQQGHIFLKVCARAIVRPEVIYCRGIRHLLGGLRDGDGGRAKRGLFNIVKYLIGWMIAGGVMIICIAIGWIIVPIMHWTVKRFHKDND